MQRRALQEVIDFEYKEGFVNFFINLTNLFEHSSHVLLYYCNLVDRYLLVRWYLPNFLQMKMAIR